MFLTISADMRFGVFLWRTKSMTVDRRWTFIIVMLRRSSPLLHDDQESDGDDAALLALMKRRSQGALVLTCARSATLPVPAPRSVFAPLALPSLTPRAFAAASASFVRREIASR